MTLSLTSIRRFFSAVMATGCVIASGAVIPATAITLFSNIPEENRFRAVLQNDGILNETDRYKLYVPADKLTTATARFVVSYPEDYEGEFDEDDIELRVRNKALPMRSVTWNEEDLTVELVPAEPVAAQTRSVSIVFSHVQNPHRTGTHYFNAYVQAPTETELGPQYIGTWILQFARF